MLTHVHISNTSSTIFTLLITTIDRYLLLIQKVSIFDRTIKYIEYRSERMFPDKMVLLVR